MSRGRIDNVSGLPTFGGRLLQIEIIPGDFVGANYVNHSRQSHNLLPSQLRGKPRRRSCNEYF